MSNGGKTDFKKYSVKVSYIITVEAANEYEAKNKAAWKIHNGHMPAVNTCEVKNGKKQTN